MSAQGNTNAVDTDAPTPESIQIRRLTLDASGYLFVDAGATIPVTEVRKQAEANGYTEAEFREFLDDDDLAGATHVTVPERDGEFGELWRVDGTDDSCGDAGDDTRQRFRDWCEERAESDKTHSYTRRKANRRYARGKDVDRSFVRDCEEFTTVLITYCRQRDGESIAEHAEGFYPRQITRKRRRILKREEVYDGYAGVSVLAPYKPDMKLPDRVPHPNEPTTHAHDFLWLPSHVSREAFAPLREVEGFDVDVSVEHHRSAEVETPESVKARGSGMDEHRGDTTRLTQELGANLPLLTCRFDARGTPEYVEEWCAHLRAGTDGSFSSQGVRRFIKLGSFEERADREKVRRKVQQGHSRAQALSSRLECRSPSHPQTHDSGEIHDSTEDSPHSTESRFTFTEGKGRVPSPSTPTDGKESEESRFTFTETRESRGRSTIPYRPNSYATRHVGSYSWIVLPARDPFS